MRIILKNADFSQNNIGNSNKAEEYIRVLNITDATMLSAIRALYSGLRSNGLTTKLSALKLFCHGVAAKNGFNLLDVNTYRSTFVADSAARHTPEGYRPDAAAGSYANSNFPVTSFNMHMHVFHTTAESTGNRFILGVQSNANNLFVTLQRKTNNNFTQGGVGTYVGLAPFGVNTVSNDVGLLSIARGTGADAKVYSRGVPIATSTNQPGTSPSANLMINEGRLEATTSTYTTTAILATAYGTGSWTDTDEANLNTLLEAFYNTIL